MKCARNYLLAAVLIICVAAISVFLFAHNHEHHDIGQEHCAICTLTEGVRKIFNDTSAAAKSFDFSILVFAVSVIIWGIFRTTDKSPVNLKNRLNN